MSQYTDIIERLNSATGADREIDARICVIDGLEFGFCDGVTYRCRECCNGIEPPTDGCDNPVGLHDERTSYPREWQDDERLPRYTSSVDACIALIERVLPGYRWSVNQWTEITFKGVVRIQTSSIVELEVGKAKTPAIALLIALFKVLEAKEAQ